MNREVICFDAVAPARERGLKSWCRLDRQHYTEVAPARERGLKSAGQRFPALDDNGRSREGAWIEIAVALAAFSCSCVAPARERGLKYGNVMTEAATIGVAPARERGLKYGLPCRPLSGRWSLPRGSVD